jgi:predicted nucleotide-binding protein
MAKKEGRIFIGHGHSSAWIELKDFIKNELNLKHDEFNRVSTAGMTTKRRLRDMLNDACFAFLVMTAEDEHPDNSKHARENVIHEVGLFQGRLGFRHAIVLLEEGCEEFSNIIGVSQIRFPSNNIKASFKNVIAVLKREKIIKKRGKHST